MKLFCISLLVLVALVECKHTFMGTNVLRPQLYHAIITHHALVFRKRVENLSYTIPNLAGNAGRTIQGILAWDLTNTDASANVTQGGIGYNYVNLRMKSSRGEDLKFEVFIYA
ncbi:uncharacterized protein LOC114359258 [Ostrinia furnacalis]|uniref:uncharacterized protein LOC114359258 n=1 Tax=Ostrinia furnacalis TaxID=93504 RepID=UPI00103B6048|nr:uncharacterized protein LOC114359258 [Ostrinia furnacalis]